MLNFISQQVKFLALLNLVFISSFALSQDDYAVVNAGNANAIPDSVRSTSFVNDTIRVREMKKIIWGPAGRINYNDKRGLSESSDLSSLRPTHKNSIFREGIKKHKAAELNLDLTVVIFTLGSKVVCYDTKVSITVAPFSLGLAFDGYELHLKKAEPIGTLDLFNHYPNRQIKLINNSNQDYYLHSGLTKSGWVLVLNKGLKGEETVFLSNNNQACIKN